jgi:hypothetical protein
MTGKKLLPDPDVLKKTSLSLTPMGEGRARSEAFQRYLKPPVSCVFYDQPAGRRNNGLFVQALFIRDFFQPVPKGIAADTQHFRRFYLVVPAFFKCFYDECFLHHINDVGMDIIF